MTLAMVRSVLLALWGMVLLVLAIATDDVVATTLLGTVGCLAAYTGILDAASLSDAQEEK